jgi:hypothetical protein
LSRKENEKDADDMRFEVPTKSVSPTTASACAFASVGLKDASAVPVEVKRPVATTADVLDLRTVTVVVAAVSKR